jgi:hypothetical protein
MSNFNLDGKAVALIVTGVAIFAVVTGAVLYHPTIAPEPYLGPNVTPAPSITPSPTPSPTASPTAHPTAFPTASPTPTTAPTPTPSPTPTPAPEATEFQNASLTYGGFINETLTWVVNGSLVDTVTNQGVSGVTVSVVDATNSSLVYGETTTGTDGYFEFTWAIMQPPTVQLIFAGNDQYIATTSDAIELPPP